MISPSKFRSKYHLGQINNKNKNKVIKKIICVFLFYDFIVFVFVFFMFNFRKCSVSFAIAFASTSALPYMEVGRGSPLLF